MGFWSWFTSSAKTAENVSEMGKTLTEGVVHGIDAVFYTDEEKARARQKGWDTLLQFWNVMSKENTEQSKARRDIAKMVMQSYFALIFIGIMVFRFDPNFAAFIFSVIKEIFWLVTMVAGIYFGPQQIAKVWPKNGNSTDTTTK